MAQKSPCKFSFVIITVLMLGMTSSAKAQSTDELIIQVPGISEKNFEEVLRALTSLNGISYSGFCISEKCFFLVVDRAVSPDNTDLTTKIKSLQLDFDVKEGVAINKAINNCTEFRSPADSPVDNTSSPN
jgi:hypothetical protein